MAAMRRAAVSLSRSDVGAETENTRPATEAGRCHRREEKRRVRVKTPRLCSSGGSQVGKGRGSGNFARDTGFDVVQHCRHRQIAVQVRRIFETVNVHQ